MGGAQTPANAYGQHCSDAGSVKMSEWLTTINDAQQGLRAGSS